MDVEQRAVGIEYHRVDLDHGAIDSVFLARSPGHALNRSRRRGIEESQPK
jgi:hypothetical protein